VSLFYRGKHRRPPRFHYGRLSLIVVLVAIATTSFALAVNRDRSGSPDDGSRPTDAAPTIPPPPKLPSKPDIYYIVFEEYGGTASLRDVLHYDNRPFLRELEGRGFYVATDSTANYPRTLPSLASSLNLEYLEHLTQEFGRGNSDVAPLEEMVDDNLVGRRLRARGYQWIHMGSWWHVTRESTAADENIRYSQGVSPVPTELFGTPVVPASDGAGYRTAAYERILFQFDQLGRLGAEPGPKFVFAHILSPHGPYVFNRQGHYRTRPDADSRGKAGAYVDQVVATNAMILGLVDDLLSRPAAERPVVIIQADEGPYEGNPSRWTTFDPEVALRKFPILNAYYLPGVTQDLYSTITPVNTFRLVFDLYFGSHLQLLPDRNYTFRDTAHIYDLTDVTDRVQPLIRAPPPTPSPSASPTG
jgi:hypothetical protein